MAIERRNKYLFLVSLCVVMYLASLTAYITWSYRNHRDNLLRDVNAKLVIAASALEFILPPDYHDRATGPDSISYDEEMIHRRALSEYSAKAGLAYVYTLVEKDGKFYFSAPTVTEEEAKERKSWYFYPYDDIPVAFIRAYREKRTVFVDYSDQWGKFRSVAIPMTSPGGRAYLACADYGTSYMGPLLAGNIRESFFTALFFILITFPFVLLLRSFERTYSKKLKEINEELREHRDNLERIVNERTGELQIANGTLEKELREKTIVQEELELEKRNLQDALNNVKVLSGLLPICSSCKKIRDDSGYWNQIESYIRTHSQAQFSHGLCPDCARRLYPSVNFDSILPGKPGTGDK